MRRFSFLGWFSLVAVYATPAFAALAYVTVSAGQGTYVFAKILFPYTMTLTALTGVVTPMLIAVALAQYFIYGFILDWARSVRRVWRGVALVLLAHVIFVALAFTLSPLSYVS